MGKFKTYEFVAVFIVTSVLFAGHAHAFLQDDAGLKLRAVANGTAEDIAAKTSTPIVTGTDLDLQVASPLLVNLEGRVPVLIVPIQAGVSTVNLNPPLFKDVLAGPKQKEIGDSLTDILMGITSIQKDIQKHDVSNASFKLEELKKRYPEVDFLEFVSGSILLLKGDKEGARKAVGRALENHPDYKDGQDFLKALGGGSTNGSSSVPAKGKKGE